MTTGLEFVYAAIDTVNNQSDEGSPIPKAPETVLLGDDSAVDSLLFVNLVVAIEEAILDETGVSVTLITEDTMTLEDSPFDTAAKLAAYVDSRLA